MKYLLGVITLLAFLTGCSQSNQNNDQHQNNKKADKDHSKKEAKKQEGDAASTSLELNNGQKWETDFSTRSGMQTIDSLITAYDQRQALNSKDYKKLGKQLKGEMQKIHQECSMEGKGHEELHKFISKIHPHIQNLKAGNMPKAQQSFEKLGPLMDQYHRHFQ